MADVKYSVEVEYLTKGNLGRGLGLGGGTGAASALASAGEKASKKWDTAFGKTFGSMSDSVTKISSMLSMETAFGAMESAAKGAFNVIKFGIIDMNAEIEGMKIGLGTMFTANGVSADLGEGMQMASGILTKMRKDAAVLPGEFKELAEIFQTILAPALNQGMSVKRVQDMATHAMAYGTSIGLRAPVIGREMAALLSHAARSQNILAQRLPGMALHGEEAKKFNALAPEELVKKLETSIGMRGGAEGKAYTQALTAYSTAWIGVLSSLKDNFKLFAGSMTSDIFERLKAGLGWVNNWFTLNQSLIQRWAETIGQGISGAFYRAFEMAKKLEPYLLKAGQHVKSESDKGELGRDMSIAGAGMVGIAAAKAALPTALSIGGAMAKMLMTVTQVAPEAGLAAIAALLMSLVPLTAIALSAAGAFEALTDDLSYYHDHAMSVAKGIMGSLGESMKTLSVAWGEIKEPLANLGAIFGNLLLESILLLTQAANEFFLVVLQGIMRLKPWMDMPETGLYGHLLGAAKPFELARKDHEVDYGGDPGADRKLTVHNHTTHIGHIEIKVVSNQDPNRIAKKTFSLVADLAKNPRIIPNTQTQFYRP